MRVLVAGGTGVLGRRIVPALLERGHRVAVLARSPQRAAELLPAGAEIVAGDALEASDVQDCVADVLPDLVMHQLTDLAAGSMAANARIRSEATRHLVDAAVAAGVRRMIVQSIAWCYRPGDGPADEDVPLDDRSTDPARRLTVDAVRDMEEQVSTACDAVVLRNGMLYGPGTWYAADGLMAERARRGELLADDGVTSFVHVDDAAAAAVAALDWPAGPVNVVDDEPAPGSAWVPAFCAAVGAQAPARSDTGAADWARGATNARARARGWTPDHRSWRTGFPDGL